ncbi:Uu.00g143910.m01.CDS01, partial [Anthostomella pinea]
MSSFNHQEQQVTVTFFPDQNYSVQPHYSEDYNDVPNYFGNTYTSNAYAFNVSIGYSYNHRALHYQHVWDNSLAEQINPFSQVVSIPISVFNEWDDVGKVIIKGIAA